MERKSFLPALGLESTDPRDGILIHPCHDDPYHYLLSIGCITTEKPVPLVYLYDENGNPLPGPEFLPKTIADLKDDPFRSLIYILIDAGLLKKDPTPFSEFHEAQYYRQKFKEAGFTLENSKEGFDKAVAEARTLPLPPK